MSAKRGSKTEVIPGIDIEPKAARSWCKLTNRTLVHLPEMINKTLILTPEKAEDLLGFYHKVQGVVFVLYDHFLNLVYACAHHADGSLHIYAVVKRKASKTRFALVEQVATPFSPDWR